MCGGFGHRLREVVSDRPKPLAQIGERPFIELLIRQLIQAGVSRIVLCTGYMGNAISLHVPAWQRYADIVISHEDSPLDTGGAVKHALPLIQSQTFYVLNGDSFCPCDLQLLSTQHQQAHALCTMSLSYKQDCQCFGCVEADQQGRITAFNEKRNACEGWVNSGIYVMERSCIEREPRMQFSLEKDLFPSLCSVGLFGVKTSEFIDIGTPASYREAQQYLADKWERYGS